MTNIYSNPCILQKMCKKELIDKVEILEGIIEDTREQLMMEREEHDKEILVLTKAYRMLNIDLKEIDKKKYYYGNLDLKEEPHC